MAQLTLCHVHFPRSGLYVVLSTLCHAARAFASCPGMSSASHIATASRCERHDHACHCDTAVPSLSSARNSATHVRAVTTPDVFASLSASAFTTRHPGKPTDLKKLRVFTYR